MKRGVIYYNTGTSCAVRLLVSLASLRRHYDGPVTILSEGDDSDDLCRRIADSLDAQMCQWDCGVPPGKHRAYLAKTRYVHGSPYETTVALDSDTLVVGCIDELFSMAEESAFCVAQLAKWRSDGRMISRRISEWAQWLPQDMKPAIRFGPAINCGVVAFKRDAEIYRDWMSFALPGRHLFIPDEVSCQVILHRYPHRILDGIWNCSCKHDDPGRADVRIIHYHGRKHCRKGLPYHGGFWMAAFLDVMKNNLAGVQDWMPAGDRLLRRALKEQKICPPTASPAGEQGAVYQTNL